MEKIIGTKKKGEEVLEACIEIDLGTSIEEAIELFGEFVVLDLFHAKAKASARTIIVRLLGMGKTQAEITERLKDWVPGTKLAREVDPNKEIKAIKAKIATKSKAERRKIIEMMLKDLEENE